MSIRIGDERRKTETINVSHFVRSLSQFRQSRISLRNLLRETVRLMKLLTYTRELDYLNRLPLIGSLEGFFSRPDVTLR